VRHTHAFVCAMAWAAFECFKSGTAYTQTIPVADGFQFPVAADWDCTPGQKVRCAQSVGTYYSLIDPKNNRLHAFCGDHLAEDIAVPYPTEVHAIADGYVWVAKWKKTLGFVIDIEHRLPDGTSVTSVYMHLKNPQELDTVTRARLPHAGKMIHRDEFLGVVTDNPNDNFGHEHLHLGIRNEGVSGYHRPLASGAAVDPRTNAPYYVGYSTHFVAPRIRRCDANPPGPPTNLLKDEANPDHELIVSDWLQSPLQLTARQVLPRQFIEAHLAPDASSSCEATAAVSCPSGSGKVLWCADQLDQVRNDLTASYCLGKNVDLSSIPNWTPLGDENAAFTGNFDGSSCSSPSDPQSCTGHTISNLTINSATGRMIGLFGQIGGQSGGTVKNVGLTNVNIAVTVNAQATYPSVGGLAGGVSSGTVSNSSAAGKIAVNIATSNNAANIGGLIGNLDTSGLSASFANVAVSITGGTTGGSTGGLVGLACCYTISPRSSITDSRATGAVIALSLDDTVLYAAGIGGLVGTNGARILRSYATGNVTSDSGTITGGLVGIAAFDRGEINQSFATGSASGGPRSRVGGLVGWVYDVPVTDSYSLGNASAGDGGIVGGFAGQNGGGCSPCGASIVTSYATGHVTAGINSTAGGLLGINGSGGFLTNAYWDLLTTGQSSSAGGMGLTTAQFQSGSLPNGFDPLVWSASPGQYPKLKWQGP